jgi:primosomal protein N' (replication factor Y)
LEEWRHDRIPAFQSSNLAFALTLSPPNQICYLMANTDMPTYARVAVDIALDKEFDYLVPDALAANVQVGSRVRVPFARRHLTGTVVALSPTSDYPKCKEVAEVVGKGKQPAMDRPLIELAQWMAGYYCCPRELAFKAVLPDVVRKGDMSWKEKLQVRLTDPPKAKQELPQLQKRAKAQARVVEYLLLHGPVLFAKLVEAAKTTHPIVRKLEEEGIVTIGGQVVERDPFRDEHFLPSTPLVLTDEQQKALTLTQQSITTHKPSVVLLHGVTGSGKTEIYLQAIDFTLRQGKGAIVLVPEIALTPQTVERFKSRFQSAEIPTRVAVLHSALSAGERHDEWQQIREGKARIVIGARSAVFAPVQNLGLIVVDEEHEHSYKQDEAPRYNARDVAVMRGHMHGAAVLLGSATPSLESYYNSHCGKYALVKLTQRVDNRKMPLMRVVDMRQEAHKQKGPQIFSERLKTAIALRLERREQTILFLNRRGFATTLLCSACGFEAKCGQCSVALTYHKRDEKLLCHICGHNETAPTDCPKCHDPKIRYTGVGTEKVERAIAAIFPKAVVRRMDSDTVTRKGDYQKILGAFRCGDTDILVGTQMIAKGLHFPRVTLVGIIFADMALHIADFRAGERTFQLLVQVAGRAGRGEVEGEVIVQTYTPFHPAVQYARQHNFEGFYEGEIEFRKELSYPPFTHLICIGIEGRNEQKAQFSAEALAKELGQRVGEGVFLSGPAPAPLAKIKTFYRFQVMLRSERILALTETVRQVTQSLRLPEDIRLTLDVDPLSLL